MEAPTLCRRARVENLADVEWQGTGENGESTAGGDLGSEQRGGIPRGVDGSLSLSGRTHEMTIPRGYDTPARPSVDPNHAATHGRGTDRENSFADRLSESWNVTA